MSALFQPGMIGNLTLKNRFIRSATRELLASDDGRITEPYVNVYTKLAKGGVGMIIPGSYYVHAMGRPSPRIIVVDNDEIIPELQRFVETIHKNGGKIVAQLNHAGRQTTPKIIGTTPLGPSPVRDKRTFVKPREMTEKEIEEAIISYGEAARRMKEAGFDGVQIHAAHGYLINQFISGYTNRRTDKWGGTLENRIRFFLEIYRLIRSLVGSQYPVLVKINAEDFVPRGVTLEQAIIICTKLDEFGIDAIEVSGGIGENGLTSIKGDLPRDVLMRNRNMIERFFLRLKEKSIRNEALFKEAYFLPQAAAIKQNIKCPVIAVGGMRKRSTMEQALQAGQADFISMCRPFIRQPDIVNQMQCGDKKAVSCNSCNRCSLEILLHHNPMKCYNPNLP